MYSCKRKKTSIRDLDSLTRNVFIKSKDLQIIKQVGEGISAFIYKHNLFWVDRLKKTKTKSTLVKTLSCQ
jgi:hypothetical protein